MIKTLSEQLCEICGIKPKQKTLPDFKKPENLVKLIEIMTDTNNIAETFLLQTIEILITEICPSVCEKKQAIREADWDWS